MSTLVENCCPILMNVGPNLKMLSLSHLARVFRLNFFFSSVISPVSNIFKSNKTRQWPPSNSSKFNKETFHLVTCLFVGSHNFYKNTPAIDAYCMTAFNFPTLVQHLIFFQSLFLSHHSLYFFLSFSRCRMGNRCTKVIFLCINHK